MIWLAMISAAFVALLWQLRRARAERTRRARRQARRIAQERAWNARIQPPPAPAAPAYLEPLTPSRIHRPAITLGGYRDRVARRTAPIIALADAASRAHPPLRLPQHVMEAHDRRVTAQKSRACLCGAREGADTPQGLTRNGVVYSIWDGRIISELWNGHTPTDAAPPPPVPVAILPPRLRSAGAQTGATG